MQEDKPSAITEEIVGAAMRLRESGVLSRSLHGNLSAMTDGDRESFWMSGSSLKGLSVGDLGRVTFEGDVVEGVDVSAYPGMSVCHCSYVLSVRCGQFGRRTLRARRHRKIEPQPRFDVPPGVS